MKTSTLLTSIFLIAMQTAFAQMKSPEMVKVEGGTFYMGNDYGAGKDERPEHEVTLSEFYMAKYEVTLSEYTKFCQVTGKSIPKGEDPKAAVYNVSWTDAVMYCNWLSRSLGYKKCYQIKHDTTNHVRVELLPEANGFRLPTEAEWEFAAKGGGKNKTFYAFSGSNDVNKVSWNVSNAGNSIHTVGTKAPNELGIYDLTGNAMEWCYDWYGAYKEEAVSDPVGPARGATKVCRGGNYMCRPDVLRISSRFNLKKDSKVGLAGIRLVRKSL